MLTEMDYYFGRIKRFAKSGGYLYLAERLIGDNRFPFDDGDTVKVELSDKKMVVCLPEWWELLDWKKMPEAYEKLPSDIKKKIKDIQFK